LLPIVFILLFLVTDARALSLATTTSSNGVQSKMIMTQKQRKELWQNTYSPPPPRETAATSFHSFVQMRSGLGPQEPTGVFGDVVFWTVDGELYESPSGEMIARIEGMETSHAIRLEDDTVRIFSRKLVWFLHPDTHEPMNEFKGEAVKPIRYDAQVLDLKPGDTGSMNGPKDERLAPILPFVVRSTRLVPCMPITPRRGGNKDILMFQVPLFIDIEIPLLLPSDTSGSELSKLRKYQAWEFYDYVLDLNREETPTLSWTRQGSTPPFFTHGNGVMHARGHRVGSFEELPQTTQDYINRNCPLFHGPPKNMEEVDKLLDSNA